MESSHTAVYRQNNIWRGIITACGLLMIIITLAIGAFLCYKGVGTFTTYGHSVNFYFLHNGHQPIMLKVAVKSVQQYSFLVQLSLVL